MIGALQKCLGHRTSSVMGIVEVYAVHIDVVDPFWGYAVSSKTCQIMILNDSFVIPAWQCQHTCQYLLKCG